MIGEWPYPKSVSRSERIRWRAREPGGTPCAHSCVCAERTTPHCTDAAYIAAAISPLRSSCRPRRRGRVSRRHCSRYRDGGGSNGRGIMDTCTGSHTSSRNALQPYGRRETLVSTECPVADHLSGVCITHTIDSGPFRAQTICRPRFRRCRTHGATRLERGHQRGVLPCDDT